MSATQFKDDLTKPGVYEEPIRSSNAGMNVALVLTLILSAILVLWAIAFNPPQNNNMTHTPADTVNMPRGNLATPGRSFDAGREVQSNNDKSYESGQQVQGDTITSGPGMAH